MASFRVAFFRLFVLEFRLFVWRVSLFRLFAWRYFVFSHGVISSFRLFARRLFVFSRGVISGRKDEKTKWHKPATIIYRPRVHCCFVVRAILQSMMQFSSVILSYFLNQRNMDTHAGKQLISLTSYCLFP